MIKEVRRFSETPEESGAVDEKLQ
ncbi:hypothetical protein FBALC1_00165 [Flavobacteriales bacterium ALC-1]|nr:hypothetical protein FBALC1_00165 [Flavobacteriales bacterium ALC-1]